MVFQSYALFPNMTVAENIGFGLKVRKDARSEIQKTGRRDAGCHPPVRAAATQYPYQLSGGQQQRVALARALAIQPQVLLLDEPLSALDAKIRVSLRNEIRRIQRQLGITTVYVTHDQEEALSLSDRVVVMNEGRMEQIGTPFEIYNFPTTSFVATFVGTLNVVTATIRDGPAGRLSIDGQDIDTGKPVSGATDSPVSLAIRPERVHLDEGPPGYNHLAGSIHDITFLGSIVRVRMSLPGDGGMLMFDTFNNPRLALPQYGDPVRVSFAKEACLVLDQPTDVVEPDPVELEA